MKAYKLLAEQQPKRKPLRLELVRSSLAPDEYVIGQERAKKVLSVAVRNHYKRIDSIVAVDDVELQAPSNLTLEPS